MRYPYATGCGATASPDDAFDVDFGSVVGGVSHSQTPPALTVHLADRAHRLSEHGGNNMSEPIGNLLDSLGLDLDLDDGELVAGAIVLLKTVDTDGDVGLRIRWSDGMGYLERIGMLHAGRTIETQNLGQADDD